MRYVKSYLVLAMSLMAPLTALAQPAGESIVKSPGQIEWKTPPTSPGVSTAVLYGNPAKPEVFVMRMNFPAGLKVMPLWRPDAWRTAVVLSGTLYFGIGERWDESKLVAYPPGTFFAHPAKTPHFLWAKDGEVIVQFTAMGPTAANRIPEK